jgi:GT2 family glycosyltransferase
VGPLALQDYGDTPFIVDAKRPIALSTANLAIRRAVLDRIGWFSEELQRAEDTELLMRFWAAGGRCLYLPEALVAAEIQPERMTREYHRWWHNANGAWTAAFNMAESIHRDGSLQPPREDTVRLYGIPAFLMRELVGVGLRWVFAALRRSPRALVYEYRFRFLTGYIRGRYRLYRRAHGRLRVRDIFSFLGQLAGKKLRGLIRDPELQKS